MRKFLILLVALGFAGTLATVDGATAGKAGKAYLCWTAMGGYTDCAWLPRGYHIPGVPRANCRNVRADSDRVEFYLTRRRIASLARQGVRTDTMAAGAWAEIQAVCKRHRKH
jgi:hypothetical protein